MSVRLFVGNLPYDATENEEIRDHFATAGSVTSVFLPVDRETGRKRGFAFVEFQDGNGAQEAIRLFNNQPFKGRALAVNEARAKEAGPRPGGPTGGFRPGGPPSGGFRPSGPSGGGFRPSGPPMHRGPAPDFMPDSGGDQSRADRTRKFGPDAKPARARTQRFKPDGGKKAFKEKLGGQIFSDVNEEEETGKETEIDNFAMGVDDTDE